MPHTLFLGVLRRNEQVWTMVMIRMPQPALPPVTIAVFPCMLFFAFTGCHSGNKACRGQSRAM